VGFLGPVDNLPALYARARVAVLSSRREGFGLVLVEAMAAGCAVVASRIPGIVDIVHEGENGWLFSVGDAPALAAILEETLTPSEEIHRRIAAGRRAAEGSFSVEAMSRRYRSFLDSLLSHS
jgi:glycosyltransferase involved in cell wall biosynthesis